jgi:release factor glutamine methyltransferase
VSAAALAVARRNAERHGIRNLRFLEGSWYGPLGGARFDAILSNPPYVAAGDPALAALAHEPRLALVADDDGLAALAAVTAGAAMHIARGGRLLVEHGHDQGAGVRALFAAAGFPDAATHADLGGRARVTEGARPR